MIRCLLILLATFCVTASYGFTKRKIVNPHAFSIDRLKLEEYLKPNFCKHSDTRFKCVEPVRNYDGDTITVNIPNVHPLLGNEISVRLLSVDTAEIRTDDDCEKEMALAAKLFVENEIMNAKKIHLYNVERDKYFRIGAVVIVDGYDLSEKLIDSGLAYYYDGGTKPDVDWCRPLDEQF